MVINVTVKVSMNKGSILRNRLVRIAVLLLTASIWFVALRKPEQWLLMGMVWNSILFFCMSFFGLVQASYKRLFYITSAISFVCVLASLFDRI